MDTTGIPRITSEELKRLLATEGKVVVIDTRKNSCYNAEHIPRAVNIFYDPSVSSSERQMALMALPGDCLLVSYCD